MSQQNNTRKAPETSLKVTTWLTLCRFHWGISQRDQPTNDWQNPQSNAMCAVVGCDHDAYLSRVGVTLLLVL